MSSTNWEIRYQTGDMPWEKGAPSPGLVDFLLSQPGLPKGSVCVPGCGTGHDVLAWAHAGYEAHGVDLAPSAVRLARARLRSAGQPAHVEQADFLKDPPPRKFDWVFEHTLFCAIEPSEREAYCRAVKRCLSPGGNYLAVNYLIPDTEGPPFGTCREEILTWFFADFELLGEWMPRSYPNRTGLERMFWWRLRPEPTHS